MLSSARVLLVSGDDPEASSLRQLLASAGHEITQTTSRDEAVHRIAQGESDVVVLLSEANPPRELQPLTNAPSAPSTVSFIVVAQGVSAAEISETFRVGASDVVDRALGDDAVLVAVERAAREGQLCREVTMLRARVGDVSHATLIGRSSGIARVRELVGRAAASRATVLITGEAGTGKDAVARLVHDLSERASRPYVTVRCGTMDAEALELELFGRVGREALSARPGLLEEARGGSIVLDDASHLTTALRGQLARAVTNRTTQRAGGAVRVPADVRLILTSRSAADGTSEGTHDDLLAQFNALPIALMPLRERRSDIPQLVQHFRRRLGAEHGVELDPLTSDEMLPLLGHDWSGNVRELEHWVERTALAKTSERPGANGEAGSVEGLDLGTARVTLEQLERVYILHVLAQEDGHQSRAAVRLGIDRRTLYRKLKQYRGEPLVLERAG